MKKLPTVFLQLLHPPRRLLLPALFLSLAALVFLFFTGQTRSTLAYPVYAASAYCLTAAVFLIPQMVRNTKAVIAQQVNRWAFGERYAHDLAFRGSVSLHQGMAVNFLYVLFRGIAGIRYASVWSVSMAAYYLVLGGLRAYLIVCDRRHRPSLERRCYRITAWLLLLLNIPMGGMILLMVLTDSGYSYPGYVIYLSAMYTFYTMAISIVNLVKYRKLGRPILSAAKVLNCIAALMSVLGLQTAMIAQFSAEDGSFRKLMNAITGGAVWCAVILTAAYMRYHGTKMKDEVIPIEPSRK